MKRIYHEGEGIELIRDISADCEEQLNELSAIITTGIDDEAKKETLLEEVVADLLRKFGISQNLQGFYFLQAAIVISVKEIELTHSVTKGLYPKLAGMFKTTPQSIERSIRHAIEKAWLKGRIDVIEAVFAESVDADRGRPTNTEFIAAVTDIIYTCERLL